MWSLLAAGLTSAFNGFAQARANRLNQRNYEEVRRYNRPIAQMARFRSAGLNPNLIYTQQNTAEPRPEWKAPEFDFSAIANVPNELATYQNVKESKARVNNLAKQNKLLASQILNLNIENFWAGKIKAKEVAKLASEINRIDAEIDNIDFEQDFKNRELNNRTIAQIWDFALKYSTLGVQKDELKLRQEQFEEFKRQFNLTHKGAAFFDEFVKQLSDIHGTDATKILAKTLAQMFLQGFSS